MNAIKFLTVIILLLTLTAALTLTALAVGTTYVDVEAEQAKALGVDDLERAVPGEAGDMLEGLGVMDALDVDTGMGKLFAGIGDALRGAARGAVKSAASVVMIAAVCAVFRASFPGRGGDHATLAGTLAIAAVCLSQVGAFVGLGGRVMDDMHTFSKLLLPTLSAAATAGGAVTSAAARYAATALFMDIIMGAARGVIMPLIYAYAAVSVAEAATGNASLGGAASLVKWLAKTSLKVCVMAFVAYVTLTGIVSGASDAVAIRAAKLTISTVLPVVGSILADAADTVLSGAVLVRNAVGVFGLLAVAGICLGPFIRLGAHYLLFKAAAEVSGAIADARITKLVDAFGAAFGLVLGMAGAAAAMLFVSIISVIRAVS